MDKIKIEPEYHIGTKIIDNVNYFRSTFEELWKSGINAIDRIKDIEGERESDDEMADAKHYLSV